MPHLHPLWHQQVRRRHRRACLRMQGRQANHLVAAAGSAIAGEVLAVSVVGVVRAEGTSVVVSSHKN